MAILIYSGSSPSSTLEKSKRLRINSCKSGMWSPCSAEIWSNSENPNCIKFQASSSRRPPSVLFTAAITLFQYGRKSPISSSSSPVIFPASSKSKIRSAFLKVSKVFCTTNSSSSASTVPISRSSLNPPVSIRLTGFPLMKAVSRIGSRVTPGVGSVIERRLCKNLLKRVDFPTFGRPAITTRGRFRYFFSGLKPEF